MALGDCQRGDPRRLESQNGRSNSHRRKPAVDHLLALIVGQPALRAERDDKRKAHAHRHHRLLRRSVEQHATALRRCGNGARNRSRRMNLRQPSAARLSQRRDHSRPDSAYKSRAFAPSLDTLRPSPDHRTPARCAELSRFFREQQHAIAVRNRNEHVHRRRCRNLPCPVDVHRQRSLGHPGNHAAGRAASPVA